MAKNDVVLDNGHLLKVDTGFETNARDTGERVPYYHSLGDVNKFEEGFSVRALHAFGSQLQTACVIAPRGGGYSHSPVHATRELAREAVENALHDAYLREALTRAEEVGRKTEFLVAYCELHGKSDNLNRTQVVDAVEATFYKD